MMFQAKFLPDSPSFAEKATDYAFLCYSYSKGEHSLLHLLNLWFYIGSPLPSPRFSLCHYVLVPSFFPAEKFVLIREVLLLQVDELVKLSLHSNPVKLSVSDKCEVATVEGLQQV